MGKQDNYGAQKVRLHLPTLSKNVVIFLLEQSNKLFNCSTYALRQSVIWFGRSDFYLECVKNELQTEFKSDYHYQMLYSQAGQSVLHKVAENFYAYQESLSSFYAGTNPNKPKLPSYRKKGGLFEITYPAQALKQRYDSNHVPQIGLPLGWDIKKEFGEDLQGLDNIWFDYPVNINPQDIIELTISPQNGDLYAIFVYKKEVVSQYDLDPQRALGIDAGVNNWLTCVPNTGKKGFIIDGKQLKSFNQFYHKEVSKAKTGKPENFWNARLDRITGKRNRRMNDAVNKAAKYAIQYCLDEKIGTLVFGWNIGQKDGCEMGRKNNQNFVSIPTGKLKERIKQLCELYQIKFIETEESYTSQSSFFDNDELYVYGEKPTSWRASGKRVKRGLYVTSKGHHISSDANGACNIMRKVADKNNLDLSAITIKSCQFLDRIFIWKRSKIQQVKTQHKVPR